MVTKSTLIPFLKKEESIRIKSDYPQNPQIIAEESYSEGELDYQIRRVISQVKNISKILQDTKKLSEEESNKIAFYSFLKFLSKKQNVKIKIKEYDSILENSNFNILFKFTYFLNRVDFLEKIYSQVISITHKKDNGQFFTPLDIANFMAALGSIEKPQEILDPATGGSIFTSTLIQNGLIDSNYTIIEKDPLCHAMSKINLSKFKNIKVNSLNMDFLNFKEGKYDLIISNPPYIRFHEISNREETIKKIEEEINIPLSRLTNFYSLFFFHANKLLKEGGKLIFITPSEFLNVNYGVSLKEFFKKNFEIEIIITFDNGALVFEDGLSTACITVLTKKQVPNKNKITKLIKLIKWIGKERLLSLVKNSVLENTYNNDYSLILIKQSELNYKEKWVKYFNKNEKFDQTKHNLIKLSELADVNRGIATGANEYFVLPISELNKWNIEKDFFRLAIAKSNFCQYKDFTNEDIERIKKEDKPLYLLYCFSEPSSKLKDYIKHGEKQEIHNRYLTSKRSPWYSMEKRMPAPIWAGVFSRENVKFILNKTPTLNLTTFHGIYPKFKDENKLLFLIAFLNSNHCKELMKNELRSYGGGLNKFEPKDLENIPVPNLSKIDDKKIIEIGNLFKQVLEAERNSINSEDITKKIEEKISVVIHA